MPQPDCLLLVQPEFGGRVRIGDDGYIEGSPDLVAEVASSSVSYDLGTKLRSLPADGVREYIVWRVRDRQLDWFVNRAGQFEDSPRSRTGSSGAPSFHGLWLDPAAGAAG